MENWQEHLENDLERAVLPHYPQIARLKETLIELGARALMTGSGAAVFAILPTIEAGQQLAAQITDRFPDVDTWLSQTIAKGIKLAKIPVK
jgi:4-diphosphocytidyl-2-C-methyl-D-erythritol kinase